MKFGYLKNDSSSNAFPTIKPFFPISALGGNLTVDFEEFRNQVRKLPKEETIFLCAKLNIIFCEAISQNVVGHQQKILEYLCKQHWFDENDFAKLKKYAARRQKTLDQIIFFARTNSLELIRWVSVFGHDANVGSYNNIQRKHGFARSMLLSFEFFSKRTQVRVWKDALYHELSSEEKAFHSLRIFRESSLWQAPSFNLLWQFGRSKELFLDLFLGVEGQSRLTLENELRMSLDDYLTCVIALLSLPQDWFKKNSGIVESFEFNPTSLCDNASHMRETMARFIELESQTAAQLTQFYKKLEGKPLRLTDFRQLREKPIITNGKARATFIDPLFMAERASNGLVFKSVSIIGEDAFKRFGDAFEIYAIRRLERYMETLRTKNISAFGFKNVAAKSLETKQNVEFCDYLMLFERNLILIEIKGKWLRDGAIETSADNYWSEICEKYVIDTSNPRNKRKGVAQLADSICGWLEGRLKPEIELDISKIDCIVPVLLTYDRHLSISHHGTFLAKELQKILGVERSRLESNLQVRGKDVLNLCLISMDDFEQFENRVLRRDFSELLFEYNAKFPDRNISAGGFLANLPAEVFCPQPGIVLESEKAVDQALFRLFGVTR